MTEICIGRAICDMREAVLPDSVFLLNTSCDLPRKCCLALTVTGRPCAAKPTA